MEIQEQRLSVENEPSNKKKRKVLWLSDYACTTGFAQVAHNIMRELYKTGLYEFDVVGINYPGGYVDPQKYPFYHDDFRLWPAWPQGRNDMFGREMFVSAIANRNTAIRAPWDIIFTLNDPFILEPIARNIAQLRTECVEKLPPENWFKWIAYWPCDAPVKENWVTRSVAQPDYPVAYCDYGYNEFLKYDQEGGMYEWLQEPNSEEKVRGRFLAPSLKERLSIIRHGTNIKDFYPLPQKEKDKFREKFFAGRVKKDDFLIVNISRNQPRKNLFSTFATFANLQKKIPNAFLYLHARVDDVGGNLQEMARHFNIDHSRWGFPARFNEGQGFPVEVINKIYNCADVCFTSTLGEGWGLISTESMATKTPLVGPNNTSFTEIFNAPNGFDPDINRAIPVGCGTNSTEWICLGQTDNERVRPLINIDDAVSKLFWVYKNPEKVKEITDRAYKWATELTWKNECKKWVDLFEKAYQDLEHERKHPPQKDLGRNDPCWCGSGKKYKHCHGK